MPIRTRFRKSLKVAPGVRLNLNKRSVSVTAGVKGFHTTINSKGRRTTTVGIPGTGISVQDISSHRKPRERGGGRAVVAITRGHGPSLLVRAVWFVLVGLWLGSACMALAWVLNISIVGMPLGMALINALPGIMTLKPRTSLLVGTKVNGVVVIQQGSLPQRPFRTRTLYFLLIGWWLSLVWFILAWFIIAVTLGLGLPAAFQMFNSVPAITTLRRQ